MRRLPVLILACLLTAVSACGPSREWTPQSLEAQYTSLLADVRQAMLEEVPGLTWQPQEPAGTYKDGSACMAIYSSYGQAADLHRWSVALEEAVSRAVTAHGFTEPVGDGGVGGWVTYTSTDEAGMTLTISTKDAVQVHVKAPTDTRFCG